MDQDDIHSCSYYCTRPDCIKAQRDELREKLFDQFRATTTTPAAREKSFDHAHPDSWRYEAKSEPAPPKTGTLSDERILEIANARTGEEDEYAMMPAGDLIDIVRACIAEQAGQAIGPAYALKAIAGIATAYEAEHPQFERIVRLCEAQAPGLAASPPEPVGRLSGRAGVGMQSQVMAAQLAKAVALDEQSDGLDISAGLKCYVSGRPKC